MNYYENRKRILLDMHKASMPLLSATTTMDFDSLEHNMRIVLTMLCIPKGCVLNQGVSPLIKIKFLNLFSQHLKSHTNDIAN